MAETASAPTIPSEWGAAVAAKVARAIRNACGVEADKYSLAADEIDGACDEAVKAALQVLAESFVIPGDVLAAPPTTLSEAVASARAEGRAAGLEEAANWLAPSRARPCDCERCDCGNRGDIIDVAIWDGENDLSRAIRALIPAPPTTPGGRTDG